jgi:hypothetical protein
MDQLGRSPLSWAASTGKNEIVSLIASQETMLDLTHQGEWNVLESLDAVRKNHSSAINVLPPDWQFRVWSGQGFPMTVPRPECKPLLIAAA